MITTVQLSTHDTNLYLTDSPPLTAGCRESVHLLFLSDTAWQSYSFSVAIWRDGRRELCQTVPLEEGRCTVPALLLSAPGTLSFSLIGTRELGGVTYRKTSTVVSLPILPAAEEGTDAVLADVANATATEGCVLAGQTFYAGTAAARTGTIATFLAGEATEEPDPVTVTAFDLAAMGLPPIMTMDAPGIELDTTALMAAMAAGPVSLSFHLYDETDRVTVTGYAEKAEFSGEDYQEIGYILSVSDVIEIGLNVQFIVIEGSVMVHVYSVEEMVNYTIADTVPAMIAETVPGIVNGILEEALGGDY